MSFQMTRIAVRRNLRWLIWILLGSSIICAFLSLATWHAEGVQLLTVQTGSMNPVFRPGDALLVRPVAFGDLQPGEIVSYRSSAQRGQVVSHRILYVNQVDRTFTTKGDRLADPDPLVNANQLVGQVSAVLPGLGRLLSFLHRPLGLALVVYLPAGCLAGRELLRLAERYYRPHYYLSQHR